MGMLPDYLGFTICRIVYLKILENAQFVEEIYLSGFCFIPESSVNHNVCYMAVIRTKILQIPFTQ